MTNRKDEWGDARMQTIMGNLLRAGVFISTAVVLIGGALYLARYGHLHPHYRIFKGEPEDLRQMGDILRFAITEHSRGLIQVGLLLLIATPVARVIFSIYGFARERDWPYVGITVLVLAILIYSLVGSSV